MILPDRAYLLCTMPRSGSTMLCNLLSQTGAAGAPNSFFRPQSMADFAQAWRTPIRGIDNFDHVYLGEAVKQGTGGTGCFGLRIMWNNLPHLCARLGALFPNAQNDPDCLAAAFGPMKFIHLSRDDKVAEAVSVAMAAQTGLWHRHRDGTELERSGPAADPAYDFDMIAREYAEVTEGDANWRTWFRENEIAPLSVTYEALSANPAGSLAAVLRFIGVDPAAARNLVPGTAKLATSLSHDWAERFRRDAGIAPASAAT